MVSYMRKCKRVQDLRERAKGFSHRLFTPGVIEALGASWGEILNPGAVESRLELISKCIPLLDEESAAIVHAKARERSRAAKAEVERGKAIEADLQRFIRKAKNTDRQKLSAPSKWDSIRRAICFRGNCRTSKRIVNGRNAN